MLLASLGRFLTYSKGIKHAMSTKAFKSAPEPAPWRKEFLDHISKMPLKEFVFASLHATPNGSLAPFVPRARTCIYRGLWAELSVDKRNQAELNERIFESDFLTLTTDVRMSKIPEIFETAPEAGQKGLSGGGGPVEAIFWAKESRAQWRFRGEAFVIGPDIDANDSKGAQLVKDVIGKRMRLSQERVGDKGQWSWSRELTAHFGNLSPTMRGTFKNPPPGSSIYKPLDDKRLALGQKVDDLYDEVARSNFRVIIIKPDEVECFYLAEELSKRIRYTYVGQQNDYDSDWKIDVLWP